jgi:hypothetical protein
MIHARLSREPGGLEEDGALEEPGKFEEPEGV